MKALHGLPSIGMKHKTAVIKKIRKIRLEYKKQLRRMKGVLTREDLVIQ